MRLRLVGLVAIGAAIGAVARYEVAQVLPHTPWPWPTLSVNVLGAFVIGLLARSQAFMLNDDRRVFWVTGVLGGFTTFSAIAVESLSVLAPLTAIAYIGATFIAGVLATHLAHGGRAA